MPSVKTPMATPADASPAQERPGAAVTLRGPGAARYYLAFFRDPVKCMLRLQERYGPLIALAGIMPGRHSRRLNVLAFGADLNRQVLGQPDVFRTTGQTLRGPAGSAQRRIRYGLTRMNGAVHKQQRQLVMPPLQKSAVEGYCASMVATTADALRQWTVGQRYDLYEQVRTLTLRIASTILFSQDESQSLVLGRLIDHWLRVNFSAGVWTFPVNLPGSPYRRMLNHAARIERQILARVEEMRASPRMDRDVLSILVRARDDQQKGMTDAELVGQATILFGASYETTAVALVWTLFLLIQHPRVMAALVDELAGVLGGSAPGAQDLDRLVLLDHAIRESMRILPPVPFTIRVATRTTELNGSPVPQGSRVICSHYLTHHSPQLYAEPQRFLPERWESIHPGPYEYMPFSAGPRMCIGVPFAIMTLKISVAMILQRFRLQIVDGARIDRSVRVTMRPRYGLPAVVHAPDRRFVTSPVRGNIHEMVALPQ